MAEKSKWSERSIPSSLKSLHYFLVSCWAIATKEYDSPWVRESIMESGHEASEEKEQVKESVVLLESLAYVLIEAWAKSPEGFTQQEGWHNFILKSEKEESFTDLLGFAVCFPDLHHQEIHENLIPDKKDVEDYIEAILSDEKENLFLEDQFEIALKIAKGSPIQAAFLAFVGSRMLARGMEKRLYDEPIEITKEMMLEFKAKVVSFYERIKLEGKKPEDRLVEDSGDTYYFWTSVCMGMVLRLMEERKPARAKIVKAFYRAGIPIMVFFRKYGAGQANFSSHKIPEWWGWYVGWNLAEKALAESGIGEGLSDGALAI